MKIVLIVISMFIIGCGKNSNTIIEKINSYRKSGVVCADKQYKATHELKTVDVAKSINSDEYNFDRYDYDAVFTLKSDEKLDKFFDNSIDCDYLFGEFTQFVSYDEPILFLGGNISIDQ